jgi:hypothetical protein
VPRKVFVAGEILTAADVNTNLMDQAVQRFADSGARGSAIPSPTEGMTSYLDDLNRIEVYNGSGWGAVGTILQVVSVTKTDVFTTASSTLVDVTGLTASITPSSTASKVLVIVSLALGSTTSDAGGRGAILRDSTIIGAGTAAGSRPAGSFFYRNTNSSAANGNGPQSHNVLDSPNTTSSVTYKVQVAGEATTTVNRGPNNDNDAANFPRLASSITLMEVAG